MTVDRRWLWAGGALAVAGGALALGVPLATPITIAAVLACPAAMYFGMGMMGRMHGSAEAGGSPSHDDRGARTGEAVPQAAAGSAMAPSGAPAPQAAPPADDPRHDPQAPARGGGTFLWMNTSSCWSRSRDRTLAASRRRQGRKTSR